MGATRFKSDPDSGDTQVFNHGVMSSMQKLLAVLTMFGLALGISAGIVKSYFLIPYQIDALQKTQNENSTRLTAVELASTGIKGGFDVLNSKLDNQRATLEQVQADIRSIERRSQDRTANSKQ